MNSSSPNDPPSSRQLLLGTLAAMAVAGVLLATVVLPAEYGIDPTGVGGALGLRRPAPIGEPATRPPAGAPARDPRSAELYRSAAPAREDAMSLVLESGEGAEIKAAMSAGERLVFGWTAEGGGVDVDMHGERTGAASDEFTSYWKDTAQQGGHGAFVAPFDGTHGWYWQNLGSGPVTIRVRTSGFYRKLYRP